MTPVIFGRLAVTVAGSARVADKDDRVEAISAQAAIIDEMTCQRWVAG